MAIRQVFTKEGVFEEEYISSSEKLKSKIATSNNLEELKLALLEYFND